MRVRDWWRGLQDGYRRDFDERARAEQLRALRDAFVVLAALLALVPLLTLSLPAAARQTILAGLPVYALGLAAVVFFVSAGLRGAFTRRRALIFAGVFVLSALPIVLAVAMLDGGNALGLGAGIVFTAVLMIVAAWRNV